MSEKQLAFDLRFEENPDHVQDSIEISRVKFDVLPNLIEELSLKDGVNALAMLVFSKRDEVVKTEIIVVHRFQGIVVENQEV